MFCHGLSKVGLRVAGGEEDGGEGRGEDRGKGREERDSC